MTTPAEATAAPIDVTVDGKQYTLTPLSDRSNCELDNWLRARIVAVARASLDEDASEKVKKETMERAFDHALKTSWLLNSDALLRTPDGVLRFVFQLLRPAHPNLTMEELAGMLRRDPDALGRVMDAFELLSGGKKGGAKRKRASSRTAGKSTGN